MAGSWKHFYLLGALLAIASLTKFYIMKQYTKAQIFSTTLGLFTQQLISLSYLPLLPYYSMETHTFKTFGVHVHINGVKGLSFLGS